MTTRLPRNDIFTGSLQRWTLTPTVPGSPVWSRSRALIRHPADRSWLSLTPRRSRRDLICHHDPAPWNLVRGRDRWVFIDWDGAGPGSRLRDLAYAAHGFVPLAAGGEPAADGPRLRALADGYQLTGQQRRALPDPIEAHTRGMFYLLRRSAATGAQPGPGCTPTATLTAGDHQLTTSASTAASGSAHCSPDSGHPAGWVSWPPIRLRSGSARSGLAGPAAQRADPGRGSFLRRRRRRGRLGRAARRP